MHFPPVGGLTSIDQPHIQRLVRRIDWGDGGIFFHTHSLDPKTEYIVDRASKYILKITTSPAVSFEGELNYYRALREAIGDMIPKTLFFSGKTDEVDEEYPDTNHRIGALMQYIGCDALLGDIFDREYIDSLRLFKTGKEITADDKGKILWLLRRFLDGADQALRKTGVIVDVQNYNIRFVKSREEWKLYYIDSFNLYPIGIASEDGNIDPERLRMWKEQYKDLPEIYDEKFIPEVALRMGGLYREVRAVSDKVNRLLQDLA